MRINVAIVLLACCSMAAQAADTITGVAHNQTVGRPAAGDEVILLRLDQRMQEEARTRTDQQGAFTFIVPAPDKLHLVRLIHQGVNYDHRASVGDKVSVDVFNAAPRVRGVTGSIEIIRIGTNETSLHVSDMIEIRNNSTPPLTQAGKQTFDVYLPAHAKIDSVLAAGSGRIGVMITAAPIPGEPDHYTVSFPLRPGATKFSFNYDLPYRGRAAFHPRSVIPLQQFAVMIPSTMKFTSRSSSFGALAVGNDNYQVEAANQLPAGEGPAFEISGAGPIPALQSQAQSPSKIRAVPLPVPAPSAPTNSAIRGQSTVTMEPSPPSASTAAVQVRWFLLGAASVLFPGALGFLLFRRRKQASPATTPLAPSQHSSTSLIQSLKDEIFQLEIDRLQGTVSPEEYLLTRRGFETTFTRVLTRAATVAESGVPPRVPSTNDVRSSIPTKKPPARPFSINA